MFVFIVKTQNEVFPIMAATVKSVIVSYVVMLYN